VTHAPGIYSTNNQGFLLSFSIANHSNYPAKNTKPLFLFMEVKVADASEKAKAKLEAFAQLLPLRPLQGPRSELVRGSDRRG